MKRIPELDTVRGFSAIIIVLFHLKVPGFYWGWACVDLFFVLSGFLITSNIMAEYQRPGFLKMFYIKRVLRIWPPYFTALAIALSLNGMARLGVPFGDIRAALCYHLVFLQNIQYYWFEAPPLFLHSFSPSWSVAVEEQYYFIWPLLILGFSPKRIPLISILLLGANIVARVYLPTPEHLPPCLLLTRGDGLAFGCLLAWYLGRPEYRNKIYVRSAIYFIGVAGLICAILHDTVEYTNIELQWSITTYLGYSMLATGIVGYCILNTGAWWLKPLRYRPFMWTSVISYGVYIYHLIVIVYVEQILAVLNIRNPVICTVIMYATIFILPTLSYYFMEKPIMGLRKRFERRWQGPAHEQVEVPRGGAGLAQATPVSDRIV